MSLLRKYLTEQTYHYRVKTVVELDDVAMAHIERAVAKYVPVNISPVMKTIYQRHPLDFTGIDHGEVFIVDLEFEYPASAYVLQQELRFALNIPEKFIVVRGDNDPLEMETQRLNAKNDLEAEAELKGLKKDALLNHGDYPEAEKVEAKDYYGDEYNARLSAYLKKIADERDNEVVAANAPRPFEWLEREPKQDLTDYNAHIPGHKPSNPKEIKDNTSAVGTIKDTAKPYADVYSKGSKKKVIVKSGDLDKK